MDYEKKYKEALANMQELYNSMKYMSSTDALHTTMYLEKAFPELKESEDEKIRNLCEELVRTCFMNELCTKEDKDECIAWLERQGDTNETINRDEFAQSVLRGAAINLITWIDYNTAKGNMCLSNMECKVIEDALVNGDWDKIYAYIKRKLERVAKKVTETEETSKEFLKNAGIMGENGELADEYRLEKQGQNPVEWSDENKNIIDGIIEYLECFNDYDCGDEPYEEYYERFKKYIKFMESLKPQSQWKPSEEQIKDFGGALLILKLQHYAPSESLESLYEQLKKL